MRGKLALGGRRPLRAGITPAHAGKTPYIQQSWAGLQDHPRACGENLAPGAIDYAIRGSPPRMRGKPCCKCFCTRCLRITPAHAGKTKSEYSGKWHKWDHPRACGENSLLIALWILCGGSPPRMRGKPIRVSVVFPPLRITPAHAGKTCSVSPPAHQAEDHPRACGENNSVYRNPEKDEGSPPRMRGKPRGLIQSYWVTGITPAHAGKTPHQKEVKNEIWDHPRACGENQGESYEEFVEKGSPPRMRGKPPFIRVNLLCPGITPAHAGKTSKKCGAIPATKDHPRACGENTGNI